jgi:transcriptional regulator with GAF, ATPase, and Fis domain
VTERESEPLDLIMVLRDVQTISGEIELEKLIEKVMKLVAENTNVQKGAFIIRKKNQLQVACQIDSGDSFHAAYSPIPLEVCQTVPRTLIDHVRNTNRILVSDDAAAIDGFRTDPYIAEKRPGAILCMPIIRNSVLTGILYLEKNRSADTFTAQHASYVRILSSYIATSLENALRYDDLKQELGERERAENALRKTFNVIKKLKEQLQAENTYLQEEINVVHNYEHIVGQSSAIRHVLSKLEQVSGTDTTILITGETGTGKELLAHAIHDLSKRKERALVTVNCAALPSTIIESELFGHEKGAFTGASVQRIGRFEIADGGSIFFDEIGELAPELQVKLLRILQEGQFERLGSSETIGVDVRIIAATNRNLSEEVQKGRFREDLFYRLNVFPIQVPSLRDRPEDIPELVWSFVKEIGRKLEKKIENIPGKIMEDLKRYAWPGNIRELRNVVERALILSVGNTLMVDVPKSVSPAATSIETLEQVERNYIVEVLEKTGWRVRGKDGAAELLGLKPTTLDSRMVRLGIKRKL